jgi:NAD(P)-dependent dehydrogenase (short-subunit alcohol dehydrogenase family)
MKGCSALVTGGAQGIGKAIALHLLQAGYAVVILDADTDAGLETHRELSMLGTVEVLHGDVADPACVQAAVERAAGMALGLRAVVSNAGMGIRKPVEDLTLEEWNRVLAVNLTAAFLLAKYAAAHLRRHLGSMVTVGSSRSVQSEAHFEAYAASKGGLVALTHSLAMSLGPEVRVNCVSPGWIATDFWQAGERRHEPELTAQDHAQHPVGRAGRPEDVAALVRFLLSPEAGFITGAHYLVDGGMTRKMIYA